MNEHYEELNGGAGLTQEEHLVAERLLSAFSNEKKNVALVDELLYKLHGLMAGKGREGQFTAFLRHQLGWTCSRPDRVARRRIARHKYGIGLISRAEYQRVMGNAPASSPLRPATEDFTDYDYEANDEAATATDGSFEFEVEEDTDATPLEPRIGNGK